MSTTAQADVLCVGRERRVEGNPLSYERRSQTNMKQTLMGTFWMYPISLSDEFLKASGGVIGRGTRGESTCRAAGSMSR